MDSRLRGNDIILGFRKISSGHLPTVHFFAKLTFVKLATLHRRNRHSAFIVALLAAILFVASPITTFAHLLSAHTLTAQQFDEGQEAPHAPVCKLCLGFAGSAAGVDNYVPPLAIVAARLPAPEAAPIGLLRPVPYLAYRSRAPPLL